MLALGIALTVLIIVFFYRFKPYIGTEYQKKMTQRGNQRIYPKDEKVEKF